jgi:hypothetical protein
MTLPPYPGHPESDQPLFWTPTRPTRVPMTIGQKVLVVAAVLIMIALPVVAAAYATANAQIIRDQIVVSGYQPSSEVEALASGASMNQTGRFLFYASRPQVNTAAEFNTACGVRPDQYLLGCYAKSTIHLYDVADERLAGVPEVAAAHEMLHAAFAHLDTRSQKRLGVLLEQAYDDHGEDPELALRMQAYAADQPGTRLSELHSIIGTEFTGLSAELERYYARYFDDRSIVTGAYVSYEKLFDDLRATVDDLSGQVLALSAQVTDDQLSYNADAVTLNKDIAAFDARNEAFGYSGDQAAFDADKAALQARQDELARRRVAIADEQKRLDELRARLDAARDEAKELGDSLDSTHTG